MSTQAIRIDESYLQQTLMDLVRIDSSNPLLSPSGKGEAEIGAYVAKALRKLGLEVMVDEIAPGRVNVVGVLPGAGGGKSLLLNAHLDTVGFDGMTIDPLNPEIRDGRLYGRGSQDMKASMAAMMAAAKALIDAGIQPAGDLLVTGVADEEYGSIGMEALVKNYRADAAIVTEPTDMKLCRAHRGFIWFDVETFGVAAHGSRYRDGVDANMRMGRFLARLEGLAEQLVQRPPHPLAGPPSLHAALIQGGQEISIYAAHCKLQIERRTIPGETVDSAAAELQALIDELVAEDPTFKATLRPTFWREPFEVDETAGIVQALDAVMTAKTGQHPEHTGQTFWTDAALLAAAGIESVLLGPVGAGLHGAVEWVDLASTRDLAQILAETTIRYCGTAG